MVARPLWAPRTGGALWLAAALAVAAGCEPKLVVGTLGVTCELPARFTTSVGGEGGAGSEGGGGSEGGAGSERNRRPIPTDPLPPTWSTGFEDGFCDYAAVKGYCYVSRNAGYDVVTSPVRSGNYAVAYTLATDDVPTGNQSRCALGGELPVEASYGAYFFIPQAPSAVYNWNLIHFRGVDADGSHGLWDVSLAVQDDGALRVVVYDHLRAQLRTTSRAPRVPLSAWFKLEVVLKRAADETGAFTVYQDDQVVFELTDIVTDDTRFGEWYLGNLAGSLTPNQSTIYVDDVFLHQLP